VTFNYRLGALGQWITRTLLLNLPHHFFKLIVNLLSIPKTIHFWNHHALMGCLGSHCSRTILHHVYLYVHDVYLWYSVAPTSASHRRLHGTVKWSHIGLTMGALQAIISQRID
jgi:hypothetical protein